MIAYPLSQISNRASIFYQRESDTNYFDCDCSVIPLPVTRDEDTGWCADEIYQPVPGIQTLPLVVEGRLYYALFIPSVTPVVVLNEAAFSLLQQPDVRYTDDEVYVLRQLWRLGFLTTAAGETVHSPKQEEPLIAWLHVTNACNLACHYCYIQKSHEHMDAGTGQMAVEAVLRAAQQDGHKAVVLKYAGGEPMLGLKRITAIHQYALDHMHEYGISMLRGTVLSNGIGLTHKKLAVLKSLGLGLTISLDGLGDTHDVQRPTVNGSPSSRLVIAGIQAALEAGITPAVSVTVTHHNTGGLVPLVEWVLKHDLPFNIHFYRQHDPSSPKTMEVEESAIIANMRRVFHVIEEMLPRRSFLRGLVDYADLSQAHHMTCAMGNNYLVFDHRGALSTCQMLMDAPVGDVNASHPINLIRSADIPVRNHPVDQKEGCKECEWRYWCAGGCPVQTFRATGRTDIKSPNCHIYKALYPAVIRLEALRLIRYGAV